MKANDPAFPQDMASHGSFPGLTKREYFAAMAMQGLAARDVMLNDPDVREQLVKRSCQIADLLIDELDKK